MQKRRVTITVDADIVEEATRAVEEGRAASVSAWIGEAMVARQANDRRLEALGELIAEYEAVQGAITDEELAQQAQADRDSAALVRAELRRAG
jgi:Arc/MetJ-type ribon-helix-helix transcriptional regulator